MSKEEFDVKKYIPRDYEQEAEDLRRLQEFLPEERKRPRLHQTTLQKGRPG